MTPVQFIEADGQPAFAALPIALWNRLRDVAEAAGDVAAFDRAMARDDDVRIPAEVAHAIAEGASPLRAWRKYRKLTIQQLADAAGITKAFASQIETGKRAGATETLVRLAAALQTELGAIVWDDVR